MLVDPQLGMTEALAEIIDRRARVIAAVFRDGGEDLQRCLPVLVERLITCVLWQWLVVLQPLDVCVLVPRNGAQQSQSSTLRHGPIMEICVEQWLRLGNASQDAAACSLMISSAIHIATPRLGFLDKFPHL